MLGPNRGSPVTEGSRPGTITNSGRLRQCAPKMRPAQWLKTCHRYAAPPLVPVPSGPPDARPTISAGRWPCRGCRGSWPRATAKWSMKTGLTRPVLEDYMAWLLTQGYSPSTRALSLSMIRVFFDACHRHGWLPQLGAGATIYVEEVLSTTNRSPGSSPSSSWPNSSPTRR